MTSIHEIKRLSSTPAQRKPGHPMQDMRVSSDGLVRFRENAIVRFLLDSGTMDMNRLSIKYFTDEERKVRST